METKVKPLRIVVIEPHADDAFLSCGAHIAAWVRLGHRVDIVTVFSLTRKRAADAKAYADAVGANWVGMDYRENSPLSPEGPGDWYPAEDPPDLVLLPLALTHDEHVSVRAWFEEAAAVAPARPKATWYYLDQPYAMTQRNGPLINERMRNMFLRSYIQPGAVKYRHIPLFKDQAKFFHYNPEEKLIHSCELMMSRTPDAASWAVAKVM